jgi:hypothetical protein
LKKRLKGKKRLKKKEDFGIKLGQKPRSKIRLFTISKTKALQKQKLQVLLRLGSLSEQKTNCRFKERSGPIRNIDPAI